MKEWKIEFTKNGLRQLTKLDRSVQQLIKAWITKYLLTTDDPRLYGKPLTGNLKGLWRYRVGDYRLICSIHDMVLTIYVIEVGHRKEVYK